VTDIPEAPQLLIGHCHSCAAVIIFDPETAPSVIVDVGGRQIPPGTRLEPQQPWPAHWRREVLCDPCADTAEAVARTLGLFPLWPVREAHKIRG
jgi:hypothetical protein